MAVLETDKKKSSQLSLMVASDVSVDLPYAELSWYKVFQRTILSFSYESTLFYNRNYLVYYSAMQLFLLCSMAWENSQHFATPPLVFPRNDVWVTRAEIPYWWRVTTQIGWATRETFLNQSENTTQMWFVTRHQYGIPALVPQTSFRGLTRGCVAKCRQVSQAMCSTAVNNTFQPFQQATSFGSLHSRGSIYIVTCTQLLQRQT